MELEDCIPENQHDLTAIERAALIGFPGLNPILPRLLEWVQDANWPVANETAALLSKAGPEIVPHISTVLNSRDGMWKYWTIGLVVKNLTDDAFEELRGDIVWLAKNPTQDDRTCGVNEVARDILNGRKGQDDRSADSSE